MEFSEKLKELRAAKGVSQVKLAESIHISRSAVAKWENGLGLPSEESLELIAEYFGVSKEELLPDKAGEEKLISKNKLIEEQKKLILGLLLGVGACFFVLAYVFIELRMVLGIMLIALGIFNMKGNIASIHWYNLRKVSAEDQKPYCRMMGAGTSTVGAGVLSGAVLEAFAGEAAGSLPVLAGVVAGLALILYAQFKYNKGIF